jgi:UDP-N-acetylmuramate--alanine ligase
VAEADESDGSFLHYRPEISIITNIEADHLDHYGDLDAVVAAFGEFASTTTGVIIGCGDDPGAAALVRGAGGITYGTGPDNDLVMTDLQVHPLSFAVSWRGNDLGRVALAVPGRHNALNAAAALAAGLAVDADPERLIAGLAAFAGTRRRFDVRGQHRDVLVVDDYAHHPTEISATLAAAREVHPDRTIIAIFQPHRFSRTAAFLEQFADALATADRVVITEVYAAGEAAIPGASGAALARALVERGVEVVFEPALMAIPELIASSVTGPACVLTLGAGDITLIAPEILAALR